MSPLQHSAYLHNGIFIDSLLGGNQAVKLRHLAAKGMALGSGRTGLESSLVFTICWLKDLKLMT